MVISRDVYTVAKRISKKSDIIKYITFNVLEQYSTKQIYDFVQILRRDINIIVTIFDPKQKEIFLLFISNKNDYLLEHHINTFKNFEAI